VTVLIATDAGAEGLNLHERCHTVFNYDLHWNPMKMEQRIGRVHRLGQKRNVTVANFALRGTIDEYVLQLLQSKINLFTMAIGALESVLADLQEGELDPEERILELWLANERTVDLAAAFDAFGAQLEQARLATQASVAMTREVLG
jgi:SNF2 family DNA or RNA helicase